MANKYYASLFKKIIFYLCILLLCLVSNNVFAANKKFFSLNRNKVNKSMLSTNAGKFFALSITRRASSNKKTRINNNFKNSLNRRNININNVNIVTLNDSYKQKYQWPIDKNAKQRISSFFGNRIHPVTGKKNFHKAIDIAAAEGVKVKASANGVVIDVGRYKFLGKYIKITHNNGDFTLYGHLSAQFVKIGERVYAGDIIGSVGSTGRSTGNHLDFSIHKNGKAIDPLSVLEIPKKLKYILAKK